MSDFTSRSHPCRLGAVILTGGTAARMDGADKGAIELGGVTLLERALSATAAADEVVVVGGQVPTTRRVIWTREEPRSGGPAAGLLAGLDRFRHAPELVAVLAVDMPLVAPATIARLVAAVEAHADGGAAPLDGAVLVDAGGRTQPLCAVYRRVALERARPADRADEHGLPVFGLLRTLSLAEVPAAGPEGLDVDTWRDLDELRESRES